MTKDLLDRLLSAARAHGDESEPAHEVGDLQEILRSSWKRLTPEQRQEVYAEHQDIVADWLEGS